MSELNSLILASVSFMHFSSKFGPTGGCGGRGPVGGLGLDVPDGIPCGKGGSTTSAIDACGGPLEVGAVVTAVSDSNGERTTNICRKPYLTQLW